MIRLKPRQRTALGETLRELANLVAGALVLGQFVGEQRLSIWSILVGIAAWVVLVGFVLLLAAEKGNG
jgi:hypothetical protein